MTSNTNTDSKLLLLTGAAAVVVSLGVAAVQSYRLRVVQRELKKGVNPAIKKELKKVTDVMDIEDVMTRIESRGKCSLCRCWRSKEFPFCDGAHGPYNRCTGDNVGAINIVTKKKSTS